MPAFLKTLFYPTLSLTILFLVGCSRDNPLSVPDEYVEPEEINCEVIWTLDNLLDDIQITDTTLTYPFINDEGGLELRQNFNLEIFNYNANVDYLINSVVITPVPLDIDIANQTNSEFNEQLDDNDISSGLRDITSIDIQLNDELLIDSENISSTIALLEAVETVTIVVRVKFDVALFEPDPDTDADCKPVYIKDNNGDVTDKQQTEQQTQVTTYTIEIEHNQFDEIAVARIELASDFSAANDEFGRAISLGNSLESEIDGIIYPATINAAIGVPHANIDVEDSGSVIFIEQVTGSDLGGDVLISAANPDPDDQFGYSVSYSDGILAISAPGEDSFGEGIYPWVDTVGDGINDNLSVEDNNIAESSGAVYLFEKNSEEPNGWRQVAFIKQPSTQLGLESYDVGFGKNILLQGNLLLIAAPQQPHTIVIDDEQKIVSSGSVHAYRYDSEAKIWRFKTTFQSNTPDDSDNDNFGSALAVHDGYILIGAPGENNGAGAAHLFSPVGDSWEFSSYLTASNSDTGDAFGTSVAISSTKIFIGASKEDSFGKGLNRNKSDNSLENSGAVYGYSINELGDPWTEFVYIKADIPMKDAQFGYDIEFDADNLIIGEPFRSNDNSLGQVYLFELREKELQPSAILLYEDIENTLSSDNTQMNARYGSSLSLFNGILGVGANGFTNNETGVIKTHSGKAYIIQ